MSIDPQRPTSRARLVIEAILVIALAVAAAIAARWLVLDGVIGELNDDAVYAMYARALLDGLGYVDTAMPEPLPATRYPIGFPALLALIMAGAGSIEAMIERLQWVGPLTMGLTIAAVAVYFRGEARLPLFFALAGASLLALHPLTFALGTLVISDWTFTLASLPVIVYLDRQLRGDRPALAAFAFGGVLVAALCMLRYIGATLLVALVLVLMWQRRFKQAAVAAAGFVAAMAPWWVFRALSGGEEYHSTLGFLLGKDGGFLFQNLGASASFLLTTVPGVLAPYLIAGKSPAALLGAGVVAALITLGAIAEIRRPRPGRTMLGAVYLAVTVGLVLVWMVRYVLTGESATMRLLLPILPFAVLAFGRGLAELRDRLSLPQPLATGVLALACVVVLGHAGYRQVEVLVNPPLNYKRAVESLRYGQAFRFIREQLPEDARLVALKAPMIHFATGRKTVPFSWEYSNVRILDLMQRHGVNYVAGFPFELATPAHVDKSRLPAHQREVIDASVVIIDDLVKAYPGLLEPVYFGPGGTIGVFKVDRAKLAAYHRGERDEQ